VVVGSGDDVNEFSWQLEKILPVPVFAQTMAQVTIARGAALAAARSTEFTDDELVADTADPAPEPVRTRPRSYAGAVTALAAATVTFVVSLSLAVGIEMSPNQQAETSKHAVHTTTPPVAQGGAPEVAPPAVDRGRVLPPGQAPAGQTPVDDPNRQPYLTRVLEHIPGDNGDGTSTTPRP
jgi:hypothetical protein